MGAGDAHPALEVPPLSRRSTTSVCSALVVVVLAGCGGSSGGSLSTFKSAFAVDRAQLASLGTGLGGAIQNAGKETDAQLEPVLTSFALRASQEVLRLKKLDPPSSYKSQLSSLEGALGAVAADLRTISTAVGADNEGAATTATKGLLTDAAKVQNTERAISSQLGLPATG
jgi:hypothetical protein